MKKFVSLTLLLALLLPVLPARAGWNPLTVAADGKGIAVYTQSSGGKQAGVLYNGFNSSLSLEAKNGKPVVTIQEVATKKQKIL